MKNLLLLLIASLALSLYSCTVVGFVVGGTVDKKLPKQDSVYVGWHEPAKINYPLRVDMIDGKRYEGRFRFYQEEDVVLDTEEQGLVRLSVESIEQTTVLKQKGGYKWVGMIVGGAIDAIITTLAIRDFSSWRLGGF